MASFNKVILMGNITRDPELRYTPKGMPVTRITVAVNRRWKAETGELREETTFIDVDAFGSQAELIAKHLRKGNPILIEGRLRQHTWEDKQTNQKRSILRVDLENFRFVGPAQREGVVEPIEPEASGAEVNNTINHVNPAANRVAEPPPEEDDVPF
ncbi:MAG: single-stranded DNA-binding protein [Verrucomicrobiae bacterium]|nr:single-stranded DNA-binding protein [Verrucomicrobiae bacterium]